MSAPEVELAAEQAGQEREHEAQQVRRVDVEIDGVPMGGLVAEAAEPTGVVLALHGGGTSAVYYDCPGRPRNSLLRTAPALGWTVIALDRPGYRPPGERALRLPRESATPAGRVDLAYRALDRLLAELPYGAGVFLLAHSLGCELAVRMAADPRAVRGRSAGAPPLLGLELSGTGLHQDPRLVQRLNEMREAHEAHEGPDGGPDGSRLPGGELLRGLLWEPGYLYPDGGAGTAARIAAGSPRYEGRVVSTWPEEFPAVAAEVRVPVRYTLAEHERVWASGPRELAEVASHFTSAPRVAVGEQACAAHNVSVSRAAVAYHLGVLSFAEECALRAAYAAEEAGKESESSR
jgi:hypothetical protein